MFGSILLLGPACGDDGSGEGSSGEESSGTGASTGEGTTEAPPETTTGEDAEGTSTGPSEGTTSTGPSVDSSGTAGSGTGAPGECAEAMDEETCTMTEGCVWLGNPMNGSCLLDDPSVCPELEMQQCQQHPACDWSNQDAMCGPAA